MAGCARHQLPSGLNMYQPKPDAPRFALGGFEIVDLTANQAIYQVPAELWTESGLPMTYNPFWIEATSNGLRAYFMTERRPLLRETGSANTFLWWPLAGVGTLPPSRCAWCLTRVKPDLSHRARMRCGNSPLPSSKVR